MQKANRLDESPFLVVNLNDLNKRDVKALEKFAKDSLNIAQIMEMANKRKYVLEVKKAFEEQVENPSDDFVKLFASMLLPGGTRITSGVIDEVKSYVKTAFSEVVLDLATKKINSIKVGLSANLVDEGASENDEAKTDIITTEDELQGFFIIKSILGEVCQLNKIYARDTKSYFGVLLDDKNYKWIARLYFNRSKKYIAIHEVHKQESRYQIETIDDIYKYKDNILAAFWVVNGL